jgi:homoserine kinase
MLRSKRANLPLRVKAMPEQISEFQKAIEVVESLSLRDQEALLELLNKRLAQQHREQLVQDITSVRHEFAQGSVQFGSVNEFLVELED